jgi:hypothetical protein
MLALHLFKFVFFFFASFADSLWCMQCVHSHLRFALHIAHRQVLWPAQTVVDEQGQPVTWKWFCKRERANRHRKKVEKRTDKTNQETLGRRLWQLSSICSANVLSHVCCGMCDKQTTQGFGSLTRDTTRQMQSRSDRVGWVGRFFWQSIEKPSS